MGAAHLQELLGGALLMEQKAENAFGAGRQPMNRRAIHAVCKTAWKAYDDALERMTEQHGDLLDALRELVWVINIAGLNNLAGGVQLGQTSWLVKATDRLNAAEEILEKIEAAQ